MRAASSARLTGAVGLCLLFTLLRRPAEREPAPRSCFAPAAAVPPGPSGPSEAARREGCRYYFLARMAVNREEESLEAWDPLALAGGNREAWRLRRMARDGTGSLRRALAQAHRAAVLARTSEESGRAARLLAFLEHEAGHHEAELQWARKLVRLQPRSECARRVLQRALRCPDLEPEVSLDHGPARWSVVRAAVL